MRNHQLPALQPSADLDTIDTLICEKRHRLDTGRGLGSVSYVPNESLHVTDGGSDGPISGRSAEEGACFTALFERFWDSAITDDVTARQVAAIERHLYLYPGARVVVVPSGCGRLAFALATRGYKVRGVDHCSDATGRSTKLAAQAQLDVDFRCSGDWACGEADCDGAVVIGHGLASSELIGGMAACLKRGARAIVEIGCDQSLEAMMPTLARAGLEPIGPCIGLADDPYAAPARSLLICVRR